MSMTGDVASLLNLPATIYRYTETGTDDYGNPTFGFTPDADTVGCWVDERGRTTESSESQGAAQWQIDTVDLFIQDHTLTGDDEVEVTYPHGETRRYELLGNPHTHVDPLLVESVYTLAVARRIT